MSNLADISKYILNEFYNNQTKLNEETLLENGIPAPLLKAYKNTDFDTEGKLKKYLNTYSNASTAPLYLDPGSKLRYRDTLKNKEGLCDGNPISGKDQISAHRSYVKGSSRDHSPNPDFVADYGKVKYTSMSKTQALSDLNLRLLLDKQPWTLDLNNMPANPKSIKAVCDNVEDTRNKITDYRFVSSYNNTYIQFIYLAEKNKIFPIARGTINSFSDKLAKYNYSGDMFNSKLSFTDFRVDYIGNEYDSIAWAIIFSDYIFKTNESKVLSAEGDRLQQLQNRKKEYRNPQNGSVVDNKTYNTYYNYQGTREQNDGRTRYNPYTTIENNVSISKIYNKKDIGYHPTEDDFLTNKSVFYDYTSSKDKMLNYQYKLQQITKSKQDYIDNNLEDLFSERLSKYKELVKNSIEEYKKAKSDYKNYIDNSYKLLSDTNYKFKNKILTYYKNIENIYKEMKKVSDELNFLQQWDFKKIQKEFGLDTNELQNSLVNIKQQIKNYQEKKEQLQQELEEHRRRIEELQRQIQLEQQALEKNESDIEKADNNLTSLSASQIQIKNEIASDSSAVKEFYKKRMELTKAGNDLQQQINKLKYEIKNPYAKEDDVINYTKKPIAKQEDKEKILNALSGLSALASGLSTPSAIKPIDDEFVLDEVADVDTFDDEDDFDLEAEMD